jgi:hypothetical protein
MDELSREDALRLNVLLHSRPQAIRIDESAMAVYGLSERGEAKVQLNPNCRDERYLRQVREMISSHVLGSPGGYPIYLRRWTRMGQARNQSLDQLLLLGEPEAVVAVVHAQGLTDEQARRAWWAMPTAENARRMLNCQAVVEGEMGRELAEYLVEYLPFEQEPVDMIESVRLVLQPGLVDAGVREALWSKARQKGAYYVGFLAAVPDALPEQEAPRADFESRQPVLAPMAGQGNPYAAQLLRLLGGPGQTYLRTVERVLKKPANQDVVNLLFDTVAHHLNSVCPEANPEATLEALLRDAETLSQGVASGNLPCPDALREVAALPGLKGELRAMLVLSRLGYPVVRPVFSHSTAIGSLMRKKLEPVLTPLLQQVAALRGAGRD